MSCIRPSTYLLIFLVLFVSVSAQPPRRGRSRDGSFLSALRRRRNDRRLCVRVDSRPLDGECTSRSDSSYGEARLAQFSYITGHSSEIPTGGTRKSAREISNIIFTQGPSENIPNKRGLNQLFVFFGQFLDHNYAATPEEGEDFDIPVPESDPDLDVESLHFVRSTRGEIEENTSGVRPINILTSAVDLDAVYGPNKERNKELLEFVGGIRTGKLRTSSGDLLPLNTNRFFNAPDESDRFFLAGDHRSNEHPVLTAMHTLFLREHNYLCDMVRETDPSLSGEDVFEIARAMNIAQFQKIVFEQFYPALIGRDLPRYRGHRRGTDPTISDIFAGAAFRIGHTLVGNDIPRSGPSGPISPVPVTSTFFNPASSFTNSEMENFIRGVSNSIAQEVDAKVVNTLRNMLFDNVKDVEGFDLVALNLQRGRDHALPTFNEIREIFNLPKVSAFSEITSDADTAAKLAQAYDNDIDEVEAFPGLLAEDHMPGSSVGRTMATVWEAEFTRLRDGDQFFFLNSGAFPRQLRATFPNFISDIRSPKPNLLRDIILRNTGISASQLPSGNIFFV